MARLLYSLLAIAALPLVGLYLLWRSRRQPEYRQYWAERLGWRLPASIEGAIWIHAVSLGETLAIESLVQALRRDYPDTALLLTHGTPTGRAAGERLASRLAGLSVCYLPYDTPWAPRRFLKVVQPCIGLLMETEVWPNLAAAARRAGVPLVLINARLSERSLRRGLRYPALALEALQGLSAVLAQTPEDAARLMALGASAPQVLGNLKFDIDPPAALRARGAVWRAALAPQRVLLLANAREGEEAMFLQAWRAQPLPGVVLWIVPRHPQRFGEVADLARQQGFEVLLRSQVFGTDTPVLPGAAWPAGPWLLLGDSLGEMPAYYAAADLCIMGGSFAPLGGHNLIEACACACPVVLGPHTFNFAAASEQAIADGAAWRSLDAASALAQARLLLEGEPVRLQQAAAACTAFANRHQGATARTLAAIRPWLDQPSIGGTLARRRRLA